MSIEIKPYSQDHIDAVRDFNIRQKAGGVSYQFPEEHISKWLPKVDNRKIYQDYFLALEKNLTVRGAYILKYQEFSLKGDIKTLACYHLPISEGIINKTYSLIGIQMLTNALKRQPLLFSLGMGIYEPLAKMLKTMGWSMHSIPFYFKVNRPFRFLRNITFLRNTKFRRVILDILAITGLGWMAIKMLQAILRKVSLKKNSASREIVDEFSSWADELWCICKNKYSMIAVRDSTTLNILYAKDIKKFHRLKILDESEVIGWAVVLDTQMNNHKQFGNMRVGSIIDCLALPENAFKVIESATRYLEESGVDIIVSNQSHISWCSAMKNSGFISGPSNFILATSKKLTKLLHQFDLNKRNIHVIRGDGDGPINL